MKYLLDMDEVLVDLNNTIYKFYNIEPTIGEWEQIPGKTAEQVLADVDNFTFWQTLPKMPWADELVSLMKNYNFAFLSCPTHNPESWAGKAAWIKLHYPEYLDRLILTREKFRLASHQHCLIDDRKCHIDAFEKSGGKVIPFPSRNGHYKFTSQDMSSPVDYVRRILNKIETQIIHKN